MSNTFQFIGAIVILTNKVNNNKFYVTINLKKNFFSRILNFSKNIYLILDIYDIGNNYSLWLLNNSLIIFIAVELTQFYFIYDITRFQVTGNN